MLKFPILLGGNGHEKSCPFSSAFTYTQIMIFLYSFHSSSANSPSLSLVIFNFFCHSFIDLGNPSQRNTHTLIFGLSVWGLGLQLKLICCFIIFQSINVSQGNQIDYLGEVETLKFFFPISVLAWCGHIDKFHR